jgi:hypothetical protein
VGDAMNMLANRGVTVTLSNGTQSNYTNPTVKDQNGKDITNGGTVDKDSTVTISGTKPADNSGDGSGDNTDDNSNNGSDTGNATGTPPIPAPRQQ